jgi:hypothetical protein
MGLYGDGFLTWGWNDKELPLPRVEFTVKNRLLSDHALTGCIKNAMWPIREFFNTRF